MKKSYIEIATRLIVNHDEGQNLAEVIDNMDISFTADSDDNADVVDAETLDWRLTDSK
jgi:hypothetical protein